MNLFSNNKNESITLTRPPGDISQREISTVADAAESTTQQARANGRGESGGKGGGEDGHPRASEGGQNGARTGGICLGSPTNWEAAESKLREQLAKIRSVLDKMRAQRNVQKNISRVVTTGMSEIDESIEVALYELQRMRMLRQKTNATSMNASGTTPQMKRKRVNQTPTPEQAPAETQREPAAETWATVVSKKKRKKTATTTKQTDGTAQRVPAQPRSRKSEWPSLKPRRSAILIKPATGQTYVDVVKTIRQKINPSDQNVDVHAIRKTKDGAVLLQLGRQSAPHVFPKTLQDALGQTATVKDMTSRVTLEIVDLDCVTTAQDVTDAINREMGSEQPRNVHVFASNARGQALAVCEFDAREASDLLKKGRIKIGWTNCRVRPRLRVTRCYRCLGFGHVRKDCTGPDRRDCCWRCGEGGHVGKACKSAPRCFLCTADAKQNLAHVPGTAACDAFKAALTALKTRDKK